MVIITSTLSGPTLQSKARGTWDRLVGTQGGRFRGRVQTIQKHAKSDSRHGTDELRLARAARAFDCQLPTERIAGAKAARSALHRHLQKRTPVIMCVDSWGHWVTVVHRQGSNYVVVDSNKDPVLCIHPWASLEKRWRYSLAPSAPIYDLHPLLPQFRVHARAELSLARVRHLCKSRNRPLSRNWSIYLEDLLELCGYPAVSSSDRVPLAIILRHQRKHIVERVHYWHGGVSYDQIDRLLGDYLFVAETYSLTIGPQQVVRAMTDLAILTSLWATSRGGIAPMYGHG